MYKSLALAIAVIFLVVGCARGTGLHSNQVCAEYSYYYIPVRVGKITTLQRHRRCVEYATIYKQI